VTTPQGLTGLQNIAYDRDLQYFVQLDYCSHHVRIAVVRSGSNISSLKLGCRGKHGFLCFRLL